MEKLRKSLKYYNMRLVAERAGISYEVLKNFSSGRKQYLSDEQYNAVVGAIFDIAGGIR